ncbi:hypothetical protein [Burkholderia pseudomallei]|uniref:hypothetical protein n=1 Tax=Burkholderia pseudomallei TaxID=28450 RepID=UPI00050F5B80|nr:hypothetical protein [Burkholderia pseudomallei]KGC58829.1 flavin-containing monooxygenase FMO:FAD-dependent pyridine nucleotide-disulfide oxidoreductase domain protein [Burkholderia pseudomallei]
MDADLSIRNFNSTTDEFAARNHVLPQSVRKRYSKCGHYFGIKPIKAPNGRLWWPDDSRERLLSGVPPVNPVEDCASQRPERGKPRKNKTAKPVETA